MDHDSLKIAHDLSRAGEPYALVTVVWRRAPSSAKAGSTAIVDVSGHMRGWVGGACAEPTLVREAMAAMADGTPRLLFVGPDAELDARQRDGIVAVPMACESEGALEVYVEPIIPKPQVVVIGRSPAVDALAVMARALGWSSTIVDDGGRVDDHPSDVVVRTSLDLAGLGVGGHTFLIVATQGHYDEPALEAALATEAGYIGLVASRQRADAVLDWLRGRGLGDDQLGRIHAPAGLDLGSTDQAEMGVAILADLVQRRALGGIAAPVPITVPELEVDPVCGMDVDPATSKYRLTHEGVTHHFCAAGCQVAFEADPSAFVAVGPEVTDEP